MSAQPISAAQAVGEVLQSPDDLLKIAAFRKRLEKEKASIDARLKVGIKEQLESTRDALKKLLNSRADVQAMKDELFAIDTDCRELQGAVPVFDQISRVIYYIHSSMGLANGQTKGLDCTSELPANQRNGDQSKEFTAKARRSEDNVTRR